MSTKGNIIIRDISKDAVEKRFVISGHYDFHPEDVVEKIKEAVQKTGYNFYKAGVYNNDISPEVFMNSLIGELLLEDTDKFFTVNNFMGDADYVYYLDFWNLPTKNPGEPKRLMAGITAFRVKIGWLDVYYKDFIGYKLEEEYTKAEVGTVLDIGPSLWSYKDKIDIQMELDAEKKEKEEALIPEEEYPISFVLFEKHIDDCNFTKEEWISLWDDMDDEENTKDEINYNYYSIECLFDTNDPGLSTGKCTECYLVEILCEDAFEKYPLLKRIMNAKPPVFELKKHTKRHFTDEEIEQFIKDGYEQFEERTRRKEA